MGGSGLDRTDDFQKYCGSGLDRIQCHRIRTGLGLKNFTVRSSSGCTHKTYKKYELLLKRFAPLNIGHVQTSIL